VGVRFVAVRSVSRGSGVRWIKSTTCLVVIGFRNSVWRLAGFEN
jgi:hypothetical protein